VALAGDGLLLEGEARNVGRGAVGVARVVVVEARAQLEAADAVGDAVQVTAQVTVGAADLLVVERSSGPFDHAFRGGGAGSRYGALARALRPSRGSDHQGAQRRHGQKMNLHRCSSSPVDLQNVSKDASDQPRSCTWHVGVESTEMPSFRNSDHKPSGLTVSFGQATHESDGGGPC